MDNLIVKNEETFKMVTKEFKDVSSLLSLVIRNNESKGEIKLKIFDENKLNILLNNMKEINRSIQSFGRRNSQITNKLMTLTMLNTGTPYRALRQCISEIERKREAIKENIFKIVKEKIKIARLDSKLEIEKDEYKKALMLVTIEERLSSISNSIIYIEGALKDIYSFEDAYNQIKKNKNIPDNWDELDFEKQEVEFHVKEIFFNLYRDLLQTGQPNMGTMEYMYQFGIHPQTATLFTREYINSVNELFSSNKAPIFENLVDFLNRAYNAFGDCYLSSMKNLGLDSIFDENPMFLDKNVKE